jgi:STE24 endopeptidase
MSAFQKGTLEGGAPLRAQPPASRDRWNAVWWSLAVCSALLGALAILAPDLFRVGEVERLGDVRASDERFGSVEALAAGSLSHVDLFDDDVLAAVADYRVPRRRVGLLVLVTGAAVPLMVLVRARRFERAPAILAASIVGLAELVRLPGVAWMRVVQDGRAGFRTSSVARWSIDHLLGVGARAATAAVLAWLVMRLIARHPQSWPARLTVIATSVIIGAVLLHPLVVHPLLLPERPLPDGPHRDAALAVVERSGLDVPVVLGEASLRTTRRNAVATGLGPTRRVVLHDTLLTLEPRAFAAITAHEIAHLAHRDPLRVALAPAPLLLLLALAARRALSGAPEGSARRRRMTMLIAAALLLDATSAPLVGVVSRRTEIAADHRSLDLSADPLAHVQLLRMLVIEDLVDPVPPRWSQLLSTHPAAGARIRSAIAAFEEFSDDPGGLATR